jgi:choline dehydrogenase-like flavoprotein
MYDYVIIGAGSAGCVLANRLSADPGKKVLLLETGPPDRNIWLKIPAGISRVFKHETLNWGYFTQPEPQLNGAVASTGRPERPLEGRALSTEWRIFAASLKTTITGASSEMRAADVREADPEAACFRCPKTPSGANKTSRFVGISAWTAKFLKCLVVCAVICEPVSTEYFPVLRENNRVLRVF